MLADSMHKIVRHRAHGYLWVLNKKKVEELLYLLIFAWSPRSKEWSGLERHEKIDKNDKTRIGMWPGHFLDLIKGLYVFWTAGLTLTGKQQSIRDL